jgi:hypothetical protein
MTEPTPSPEPSPSRPSPLVLRSLPKPYTHDIEGTKVMVIFTRPADAARREADIERVIAQAIARKRGSA